VTLRIITYQKRK